jgi:hypothetical protein
MTIKNAPGFAPKSAKSTGKGFVPSPKVDRPAAAQPTEPATAATTASNAIPNARESALALSTTSHSAMNALQSAGLQNAAAYVQRKTAERNAIVDKVSDAIAYLSDPDLLESDIMSAAAAKVAARSEAWGYEGDDSWDNLFALPSSSQRMLGGS